MIPALLGLGGMAVSRLEEGGVMVDMEVGPAEWKDLMRSSRLLPSCGASWLYCAFSLLCSCRYGGSCLLA